MALNLANEDDGGSQIEISQKDNPSSNAGKVTGVCVFFDDQCSVKLWALIFFSFKSHNPFFYYGEIKLVFCTFICGLKLKYSGKLALPSVASLCSWEYNQL